MALQSTTALATVTLQQASSTVTFSGIPNTYRDLILVIQGTTAASVGERLQFNGDTTASNYSFVAAVGNGTSAVSQSGTNAWLAYNLSAGDGLLSVVQIMDYSATNKHKTSLHRGNSPIQGTEMLVQRWSSNVAINQVTVLAVSTTWNTGATFSLYGRIA